MPKCSLFDITVHFSSNISVEDKLVFHSIYFFAGDKKLGILTSSKKDIKRGFQTQYKFSSVERVELQNGIHTFNFTMIYPELNLMILHSRKRFVALQWLGLNLKQSRNKCCTNVQRVVIQIPYNQSFGERRSFERRSERALVRL